jgi:hypothetical protein
LDIRRYAKAFVTVVREALWRNLGKIRLSTELVEGVKGICRSVKIIVEFEENRVLEEFDSNIGLRRVFPVTSAVSCIY